MKIAIIGEKNRAAAWEKHLRKLSVVREVLITSSLKNRSEADAALLLDDSAENLLNLVNLAKLGVHTYLITQLPVDKNRLEQVHHASQESDVRIQFSHWPSLSPASLWMNQQVKKPDLIQIKREVRFLNDVTHQKSIDHHWIDEVAWIIKWMGGNVHRIEVKPMIVNHSRVGMSLTLRYEDSSIASIQFSALGRKNHHQRTISDGKRVIDCDAISQTVYNYQINDFGKVKEEEKHFDPKATAEVSVLQFIKSIQLKRDTLYNPYDALQTASIVDRVQGLVKKL